MIGVFSYPLFILPWNCHITFHCRWDAFHQLFICHTNFISLFIAGGFSLAFHFVIKFSYYFSLLVSTFHWLLFISFSFPHRISILLFIAVCFSLAFHFSVEFSYYLSLQASTFHWVFINFSYYFSLQASTFHWLFIDYFSLQVGCFSLAFHLPYKFHITFHCSFSLAFHFAIEFSHYFSLLVSTFHWLLFISFSFPHRISTLLFIAVCFSLAFHCRPVLFIGFSLQVRPFHWLLFISFSFSLLLIGGGLPNMVINPKIARKQPKNQEKLGDGGDDGGQCFQGPGSSSKYGNLFNKSQIIANLKKYEWCIRQALPSGSTSGSIQKRKSHLV